MSPPRRMARSASLARQDGKERIRGGRGVIRKHEVQGAVGEQEVVGIRAVDQWWEVDEVDPSGVLGSRCLESIDHVAGTDSEAEDVRQPNY
jgi:hypothetical protein